MSYRSNPSLIDRCNVFKVRYLGLFLRPGTVPGQSSRRQWPSSCPQPPKFFKRNLSLHLQNKLKVFFGAFPS